MQEGSFADIGIYDRDRDGCDCIKAACMENLT